MCQCHFFLFGGNLQTRLDDIRASKKIRKTTVPENFDQGKGRVRGCTQPAWSNNNTGLDGWDFIMKANNFKAGQLLRKLSEWRRIISDAEVLTTVAGEKIVFISLPQQKLVYKGKSIFRMGNYLD